MTDATTPTDGSPGTTDASWLAIVDGATCAGCGLHAAAVPPAEVGDRLTAAAEAFAALLTDLDDEALRRRPDPATWSALEYAVHVRDAVEVFTGRIGRMLTEVDPDLGWWDHEAAIAAGAADGATAAEVADGLRAAVAGLVGSLPRLDADGRAGADGWSRRGVRRGTEVFTVASTARFALHEVVHHAADAAASAAARA